jgi:hypothetical protein
VGATQDKGEPKEATSDCKTRSLIRRPRAARHRTVLWPLRLEQKQSGRARTALTNGVWRCWCSSPSASGDRLSCSAGMVRIAVSRSGNTERHQTALRGRATACSHAGTALSCTSLSGEMLDLAPQKPLRADEPVTQNDELGPRG